MIKILVTGGAGFIGSAIIKVLQHFQYEVFVIDNLSFGRRNFISIPDDHFFEVDILNYPVIQHLIREINPDWVIHLAAIHFIPYCNQYPFEASGINIQGTFNLLEALKNTTVKKILFASSAAVYPVSDEPMQENLFVKPIDIYGLSKLAGEQLMHKFYLETSVPVIVCRFFNAIGPNETNLHLFPAIHSQLKSGQRTVKLGNLLPKRDYIHVQDITEAVHQLMLQFKEGYDIFNVGSGIEYTVVEIVEAFERAMGEKIVIEIDETKVRKTERMHLSADISKLKNFINWTPAFSLQEAIKDLLNQYER